MKIRLLLFEQILHHHIASLNVPLLALGSVKLSQECIHNNTRGGPRPTHCVYSSVCGDQASMRVWGLESVTKNLLQKHFTVTNKQIRYLNYGLTMVTALKSILQPTL